ncbi:MAG: glycoside hydrolase family 32 protein [Chitinophagaceae bacterium]
MKKKILKFLALSLIVAGLPGLTQSQKIKNIKPVGIDTVAKWEVTDPYYPKYHLAPPYGWMNDPHPAYLKGAYHFFYQFSFVRDNPYGRIGLKPGERPQRTWGHAVSTDLVHWKHMPIALKPSLHGRPNDPHLFSGVVVDNNGTGTALYTINNVDIWMATSKDHDLATFTKYPNNPVVKGPPPGLQTTGSMRDPWVWKEGNTWYMIIGSGLAGGKGPVLPLYKSSNLIDWEYMHPFYRADSSEFDFLGDAPFCECPAFFPLGNKYVLVLSDKTTYLVGRYENHRFIPEKRGRLDYGEAPSVEDGGIYVPLFVLDDKGRRIMWGWAGGWRKVNNDVRENIKAGWSGLQTIPRVVTLNADGLLNFEPAEELSSLRSDHREFSGIPITADSSKVLEGVQGLHLEIKAVIKPGTSKNFGIEFLDVLEDTKVFYDVEKKSLCFNQIAVPMELNRNDNLDLSLFIDGKVLEIYANKKIVLTEQLKPVSTNGYRIKLFAQEGRAGVIKVDTWKMGTIW